jgi:hypothetical protein
MSAALSCLVFSTSSHSALRPCLVSCRLLWPRHIRWISRDAFRRSLSCCLLRRSAAARAVASCAPGVAEDGDHGFAALPDKFICRDLRELPVKVGCIMSMGRLGNVRGRRASLKSYLHTNDSLRGWSCTGLTVFITCRNFGEGPEAPRQIRPRVPNSINHACYTSIPHASSEPAPRRTPAFYFENQYEQLKQSMLVMMLSCASDGKAWTVLVMMIGALH